MANVPPPARKSRLAAKPPVIEETPNNLVKSDEDLVDMNFRVPASIHRQVKLSATILGMPMKEMMLAAFVMYRNAKGLDYVEGIASKEGKAE